MFQIIQQAEKNAEVRHSATFVKQVYAERNVIPAAKMGEDKGRMFFPRSPHTLSMRVSVCNGARDGIHLIGAGFESPSDHHRIKGGILECRRAGVGAAQG